MKTYQYAAFLRCPKTGEVQHGTVEFDHDGFMDCHELFKKLNSAIIGKSFNQGYTLIGFNIVSVSNSD